MTFLAKSSFELAVDKVHDALKLFYKGDKEPYNRLFSSGQDISLLGAQGGVSVGSKDVAQHLTSRVSWFQAGENVKWDRIVKFSTQDLGYVVEIEQFDAKVGGTDEAVHVALRATTILRLENGEWRVIHRIADPLVDRIDPETYRSLAKHNKVS